MKIVDKIGPVIAIGVLLTAGPTRAQGFSSKLAFEVATIKPAAPIDWDKLNADARAGKMPRFVSIDGAQDSYRSASLKVLIAIAYGVKPNQIAGPAWLDKDRFDVFAKLPEGASERAVPAMMQSLLADRFKVAVHWESREQPVLALVVGADGPELIATATPSPVDENAALKPYQMKSNSPNGPVVTTMNSDGSMTFNLGSHGTIAQRFHPDTQTTTLDCTGATMAVFADRLTQLFQSRGEGRRVVDMTRLQGNYKFSVVVDTPRLAPTAGSGDNAWPAAAASEPSGGASLYASVKKLGLKVEPGEAPVQQLVVDHAEKTPTEN